jgi:16S rRNA (cytidine1402-2'-O)-methyltransferase
MASGLNAESFRFNGYLPRKPNKRIKELQKLANKVLKNKETQIFIEAPYRNQVMFDDILKLPSEINLCVGIQVGGDNQEIVTMPISQWKQKNKKLEKVPIIYIIGK